MRTRLTLFLSAALVPAALFAACGDDNDDAPSPTPTRSPVSPTPGASSPTVAATATVPAATATRPAATATSGASPTATLVPGSTNAVDVTRDPATPQGIITLKDVRIGTHDGYDRIVFEFDTAIPRGRVEYVNGIQACGSGKDVVVEGNAILHVRLDEAQAHTPTGQVTIPALEVDGPGTTIIGAEQTCDFEALIQWAVGIKGRQNFVVTKLQSPPRLVIDVRH